MNELFDVRGKNILITGSTRGIGYALAKGFVEAGARVVINGVTPIAVDDIVEKLKQLGGDVYGYCFDICNEEQVEKNIHAIEKEVGEINVLINNAGIHRRALLHNMSIEDWNKVIDVNLTGAFIVGRCVSKEMIKRKDGRIINITSLNAEGARPSIANYSAAKGGLKMLTKSMATEWGKYNINVNAIGPGYFKTDLTRELVENEAFDSWVRSEVPLGRWGETKELIGAAIFLASSAASYINGQTLYVDGGWRASL